MNAMAIGLKRRRRAFTFIELVAVMAIMGLLLTVAVPRIGAIYDRQLVEQQARLLEQDLRWLRSEAQRTGEAATFQRQGQQRYTLTVQQPEGPAAQTRELVSARMTLSASSLSGAIIFEPGGTAFDKCTLTLRCGAQTRTVAVSNLGRIRVGVTS